MIITEEHRRIIAAAIPPGIDAPERFWRDLETAITSFNSLQELRTEEPPVREQKRWARIEKLVDALDQELQPFKQKVPGGLFQALWELRVYAKGRRTGYKMLTSGFKGRRNLYRESLYADVCDLWTIRLGQKLRYSMSQNRVPSGPLIRFFRACVKPILGADAPTAHTMASIITAERKRRYSVLTRRK